MNKSKSPLLIVVDVQNDFMLSNGSLYVKDAESIISNIKKLIDKSINEGFNILYTSDCHYEDAIELSKSPDFINTFPTHCIRDTWGYELVNEINKDIATIDWIYEYNDNDITQMISSNKEIKLLKDKFDMFSNPNTLRLLNLYNPSEIHICGVVETICVKYAVEGSSKLNKSVYVYENCIKNLNHIPSLIESWKHNGINMTNI